MPDPYATRAPDLSGRPSGPPPWLGLIAERGGAIIGEAGDLPEVASFVVVDCRGIGTLAPLVRLEPALAALLWLEHTSTARTAGPANELLGSLDSFAGDVLAIKQGSVGGPADRAGCFDIPVELVERVLDAALAGEVEWERDPDFGYEVPARVRGLTGEPARALLPRLLYADHDRVYEHAGLVAAKKRERDAIAAAVPGLDPAVRSASGWPPVPSPAEWRA